MPETRFDGLARSLALGASRRTLLRGLGGGAIAALLTRTPAASAPPEKVTLCHKPGTPDEATIEVSERAVPAHLRHGDALGACPEECPVQIVTGPPVQGLFTFQDTGPRLAEILVTRSENADTVVPPFTVGTNDPVVVTSTKIDQTQASRIEIRVTNLAGDVRTCDVTLPRLQDL